MNSNHSGLCMTLRPMQDESRRHDSGIPAGIVLLAGIALAVPNWFPSVQIPWFLILISMLTGASVLWLLERTGKGRWLCLGALVLIAILCIIFRDMVLAGIGCLGNDLLNRLTQMTGRIYLDFASASSDAILWGLIPVLAMAVLLLHLSMQTGKLLFLLPILLPVYGAVLTGFFPVCSGVVLIGFGGLLLLVHCNGRHSGIPTWLVTAAVCAVLVVGAAMILGDADAKTEEWDRVMHERRYDQDTNSMPEGDLKNLRQWKKSETPALELTMSEPQKLYLRGQVYETYEGTAWKALSPEARCEQESLFYWLHQSDFYGQSQVGTASAFAEAVTPAELTIRNVSACSAHGYYPYALYGGDMLDADLIGDGEFPAANTLRYLPGSVPEWYTVQHTLAASQKQSYMAQYLAAEAAYEAYVTSVDLQLTNESWSVLERQTGGDASAKTLAQIQTYIRDYLAEAIIYDETVRTRNGSGDFLQYTLEQSGSGYSVHYATAATLMLRYFGVPARYVEGYFLSKEEAANYAPGDTIVLTEEHAHAWAEYYLPGVGFVPFEVTPGYIDKEELEMGGDLMQNEQTYSGDHLQYAQVEQPEEIKEPEQDRLTFSFKPIYLLYLLALLLLVLAVMILVRRKRFNRAITAIASASNRDAIAMRFGYAVRLLQSCATVQMVNSERAAELNREALFSNHEMTSEQRQEMDDYAGHILTACKERWTIREKLRYRLWDCLY